MTKELKNRSPLRIFLSYFKPHRALFALDMTCAVIVSLVDLAFPLVTREAMYDLLPEQQYRTFFIVMAVMLAAFTLRAVLYYVIAYWDTRSASVWRRTSAATCSSICRSWTSAFLTKTAQVNS